MLFPGSMLLNYLFLKYGVLCYSYILSILWILNALSPIDSLTGDLEIVESSMMQTKEDLASWQREVQKRLDQESKFIADLRSRQPHSGTSSSNQSEEDEKDM